MLFGIPLSPLNFSCFAVLFATFWIAGIRYARGTGSNIPLFYWTLVIVLMKVFEGTFDGRWILSGAVCALILRFEFIPKRLMSIVHAGELLVLGSVTWRAIGILLLW